VSPGLTSTARTMPTREADDRDRPATSQGRPAACELRFAGSAPRTPRDSTGLSDQPITSSPIATVVTSGRACRRPGEVAALHPDGNVRERYRAALPRGSSPQPGLMPAALTLTRTSPGPGSGTGDVAHVQHSTGPIGRTVTPSSLPPVIASAAPGTAQRYAARTALRPLPNPACH